MSGRRSRSKGSRGELEIVELLRAHGWTSARRNFASGASGGGDLVGGPQGVHVEVKRCETARVWDWIAQAEADAHPLDLPVVMFRRSRSGWYAALPADELLALLRLREAS